MKKRIMGLVALSLVGAMMVTSLTGCGVQTEATNITVDDGDTIIVDQEDMETETPPEETEVIESDEITSEEVIGDNTEEPSDFAGAEDENIVLYAEIAEHGEYGGQKDKTFESVNNILTAPEDVPVFNGDGIEVGYIKADSTISITEYGLNNWARFENPIDGTDYDYLYVMKDYITDGNLVALTTAELETMIKESLGNRSYDAPVFTELTDDMELFEFRIPMNYNPETDTPIYWVYEHYDRSDVSIMSYKTYSVVCTKDTDDYIICQIYYKDVITDDEWYD